MLLICVCVIIGYGRCFYDHYAIKPHQNIIRFTAHVPVTESLVLKFIVAPTAYDSVVIVEEL